MKPCNQVTPKISLNSTTCVFHEPSSTNCFSDDMFVLVHVRCLFAHKSSVKVRHWMFLEKIQNNYLELLYGDLFRVIVYHFRNWIDALLSPLDIFYAFFLHVGWWATRRPCRQTARCHRKKDWGPRVKLSPQWLVGWHC